MPSPALGLSPLILLCLVFGVARVCNFRIVVRRFGNFYEEVKKAEHLGGNREVRFNAGKVTGGRRLHIHDYIIGGPSY